MCVFVPSPPSSEQPKSTRRFLVMCRLQVNPAKYRAGRTSKRGVQIRSLIQPLHVAPRLARSLIRYPPICATKGGACQCGTKGMKAAVTFSTLLLQYNYHPLCYQHTSDLDTNVRQRHRLFNHCHTQEDERVLTYAKGPQQLLCTPQVPDITEQSPFSVVRTPPVYIQRRLLHTLGEVSVVFTGMQVHCEAHADPTEAAPQTPT